MLAFSGHCLLTKLFFFFIDFYPMAMCKNTWKSKRQAN